MKFKIKPDKTLNEIFEMISTFKNDKSKLEQLHKFICEELFDERDPFVIPKKLAPIVQKIAKYIDLSMFCFLNPETLELIAIPEDIISGNYDDSDEIFKGDIKKVEHEWKNKIVIEPPNSTITFTFMEDFIHKVVEDDELKNQLANALRMTHPFASFINIIHNSPLKEQWFEFKYQCLKKYTIREIAYLKLLLKDGQPKNKSFERNNTL